jgi:hypothetical protein
VLRLDAAFLSDGQTRLEVKCPFALWPAFESESGVQPPQSKSSACSRLVYAVDAGGNVGPVLFLQHAAAAQVERSLAWQVQHQQW